MDLAHPCKMAEDFRAAVELQIVRGAVAFMAAHHRGKCGKVDPAVHEFCRPHHAVQAGVAAQVAMVIGIAQQSGRQSGCDDRIDAVMAREIDSLVARP